jgi:hypothetical protein
MTYILRRLPVGETSSAVEMAGETVPVRAYQIILWVSLAVGETLADDAPRFPAVLDTGHSHNCSIQEGQLVRWAGLEPGHCRKLGAILVNRQEVPLLGANLWVHRNRPGTAELLPRPVRLAVPEGISIYPSGAAGAARLPLLGLRGIIRNRLRLLIDGAAVSLSLKP